MFIHASSPVFEQPNVISGPVCCKSFKTTQTGLPAKIKLWNPGFIECYFPRLRLKRSIKQPKSILGLINHDDLYALNQAIILAGIVLVLQYSKFSGHQLF